MADPLPENLAYRAAWDTSSNDQKVGALTQADANYIKNENPRVVSLEYDPSTGNFGDIRTQEEVYPDEVGRRLAGLHAEAKARGDTDTTGRVGETSGRRYLATKALLQGQDSRGLGRGLYQGSLDRSLYSRAPKVNWKPPLPTRRSSMAMYLFLLTIFRAIP